MQGAAADAVRTAIEQAVATFRLELLGPELTLLATGLVALILSIRLRQERQLWIGYVTIVGVLLALALLGYQVRSGAHAEPAPSAFSGLLVHDAFAVYFKYLFLIATFLTTLLSIRYLDEERRQMGEYYALLCFATLGMMFMASGQDLITIYVGLELMALSVYVLVGFLRGDRRSNEAAMKYFILGAFSSGFFVYGISLLYGVSGGTSLEQVASAMMSEHQNSLVVLALIMLTVGLGFKVAAVPFHAWAPDVYQGAPTPITAYVSVASKSAAFAVLLRILLVGLYDLREQWTLILWVLAAASMIFGNLVAVVQDNVKRMLAYSSIAHAGYLLLGVLAAGAQVPEDLARSMSAADRSAWIADLERWSQGGVLVYLLAYTFMSIGAFGLITMLRRQDVIGDRIRDFTGLFQRAPAAAVAMAVFLLSLGGIPPTAGFVGKLLLFAGAIKARYYVLAVIAVLSTVVSIYFYFRIVVAMWMQEPEERRPYAGSPELAWAVAVALLGTIVMGLWPAPFLRLAQGSILSITMSLPGVTSLP